jgi:hypothetical protein
MSQKMITATAPTPPPPPPRPKAEQMIRGRSATDPLRAIRH